MKYILIWAIGSFVTFLFVRDKLEKLDFFESNEQFFEYMVLMLGVIVWPWYWLTALGELARKFKKFNLSKEGGNTWQQ